RLHLSLCVRLHVSLRARLHVSLRGTLYSALRLVRPLFQQSVRQGVELPAVQSLHEPVLLPLSGAPELEVVGLDRLSSRRLAGAVSTRETVAGPSSTEERHSITSLATPRAGWLRF